jgi:uncharacterized membrane protein YbhN (UPF0104 family)
VGYLLYRHGFHYEQLKNPDPAFGGMLVAAFVLQIVFNTFRWRLILAHLTGSELPYRRLFSIYYVSAFFMQVLPSIGGDLVRVMYCRALGSKPGPVMASVLVDRGIALATLLVMALFLLPFLTPFDNGHVIAQAVALIAGGGLIAAYGGCVLARGLPGWPIWTRLPYWMRGLVASAAWSLTSWTGLCRLMPLSALTHLLSFAAIFLAARAMHVPLTFVVVLAIGPALLLAHVLPISIGGWGVREATAVAMLGMTGLDATSALLVSVVFGLFMLFATLPGAVFWLLLRE